MQKIKSMFSQNTLLCRERYTYPVRCLKNSCRMTVVACITTCITSSILLSGCGQKGDLYLPDDTNSPSVHNADKNADRLDNEIDSGYDAKPDDSPLPLDNPHSY